jgi:hypothetical protein
VKHSQILLVALRLTGTPLLRAADQAKLNILFIATDHLNDWTGFLGGHPQAITPNMGQACAPGRELHQCALLCTGLLAEPDCAVIRSAAVGLRSV